MSNKALEIVRDDTHELELRHDPEAIIGAASRAARALQDVVARKPKPVMVNGEQYLEYEDWQTLGQFYGYTARTVEAKPVEINGVRGAFARAELVEFRTGLIIGGADAYCMADEPRWGDKPFFQLASMAQTRAAAKALRNRLAWVAVLAGYKPTPAEEMEDVDNRPARAQAQGQEHWCPIHNTAFRRMTSKTDPSQHWYSHSYKEPGATKDSWCNEEKVNGKARPEPPAPAKVIDEQPQQRVPWDENEPPAEPLHYLDEEMIFNAVAPRDVNTTLWGNFGKMFREAQAAGVAVKDFEPKSAANIAAEMAKLRKRIDTELARKSNARQASV